MDQKAFRQLLSTPRSDASSSAPSNSSFAAQRYLGKPIKKRDGLQSSPVASNLLPRKFERSTKFDGAVASVTKEPLVNSATGETYIDRAKARRLGEEDDNKVEESESQTTIKKGLDMELLALQKAKLNGGIGVNENVDDDDLEQAYGSSQTNNDDRSMREKAIPSKFKPIGSTSKVESIVEEDKKPKYIWRDGKRLRKKKKKARFNDQSDGMRQEYDSAAPKTTSETPLEITTVSKAASTSMLPPASIIQSKKPEVHAKDPPIASAAIEKAQSESRQVEDEKIDEESEDEGGDIFADAGRWKGIDDSDDDDDQEGGDDKHETSEKQAGLPMGIPIGPSGRKDWFATGRDSMDKKEALELSLPSELGSIVKSAEKAQAVHDEKDGKDSESESEEEADPKPQRLEGFSDSVLGREGVRYMLDKKDDGGPDKKRKRKRSKKGKGGYGSD